MTDLGAKVRDTVTGYEGVAVKRLEELHGHSQIAVERADAAGAPEQKWFAEGRLEPVEQRPAGFGIQP